MIPAPEQTFKKPAIFCDFDGTITQHDVIQMIMEAFAPPVWRTLVDDILNKRTLSIKDGIKQLFHLIPGTRKAEIEAFVVENVRLREGFPEFLDFCQAHQIPFRVVSGGVDFFIRPVLAPYAGKLEIFSNEAVFHPDRIELTLPYFSETCAPCGQCACCKIKIMEDYGKDSDCRIAIGDSLTDLAIARAADWTFARDRLITYTREEGIATTPFETFHEIRAHIAGRLLEARHA